MAIYVGKPQNKETVILSIIWEIKRRFKMDARSLFERSCISWKSTRTWSNWRGLYQDGRACAKDFRHHVTQGEHLRYRKNWLISLNNSGRSGPLKDRSDFNDACTTSNRLHQESGERQLRPVPLWKYQNWHQSSKWVMVELIIQMKVRIWAYVQSDMIERWDTLFAVFGQSLRRATFKIFFLLQ